MADMVTAVAAKVVKYMVHPISEPVGYLLSYKDNFNVLRGRVEQLNRTKERFIGDVEEKTRDGREIEIGDVARWLAKVDETLEAAKQLSEDLRNANAVCSPWSFPNLKSRYQYSRKAMILAKTLAELGYYLPLPTDSNYGSQNLLESRNLMMEELVLALGDPKVRKIGIYGLAGVGKTFLAQEVAEQVKVDKLFDVVVMTTVSQTLDVERIQHEIEDQLGLNLEETATVQREHRISERIKEEESILIILDDIWETIELEELGISLEDSKGCKLLLISRNRHILQKNETQKDFKLEVLNDAESLNLFQSIASDGVYDANLRNIAKQVAQRCAGLPAAIVTMAKLIKDKGISDGKEALRNLNESDYEEMEETIYSSVELSFNKLEDEVKELFLLSGVHGTSILVSDLLKCVIGLGVFKHVNSIDDARYKLYRMIGDLEESSLLLDHSAREVKMLALICNFATLIASRHHFVFTRNASLTDWPGEDYFQRCTQIILKCCSLRTLPEGLICPNLKFLYLNSTDNRTLEIPHSFFEGMEGLQVLDLIGLTIPLLPTSLVSRSKLKTLCLDQCDLKNMIGIGGLENLEILSFFCSSIKEFPSEIRHLTHLRMLDLSSSKIEVIPPNIMSKLMTLEELYMGKSIKWEVESSAKQHKKDILVELGQLTSLTALELQIHEAWILPNNIIFEELQRYNIVIGDRWEWSDHSNGTSKLLKLKLDPNIPLEQEIKALVETAEDLYLDELCGISNVLYELNGEGFPLLKNLHIQNNSKIRHIVSSMQRNQTPVSFPNLGTMILDNLSNLKGICDGPLTDDLFEKLEVIKVKSCSQLKYLFLVSEAKDFSQILEIEVSKCSSMKNIVSLDSDTTVDDIRFISLHSLTLRHLPAINGFYSYDVVSPDIPTLFSNAKAPLPRLKHLQLISISTVMLLIISILSDGEVPLQNLETMEILECDNLRYLFVIEGLNMHENYGGLLPELRQLCLRNLGSFRSIVGLNHPGRILNFNMLRQLTVCSCNQLKYLLPRYVLWNLQQLQDIDISDCEKLERLFGDEEDTQMTESNETVLPLLHSLKLSNLPELVSFCSVRGMVGLNQPERILDFRRLKHLTVGGCNQLKHLLPLDVLQNLQRIRSIDISDCEKLERVFGDEEDAQMMESNQIMLSLLQSVKLSNLPELSSICLGACHIMSRSLTQMTAENCPKYTLTFGDHLIPVEEQDPSKEKLEEMFMALEKYKDRPVSFMHLTSMQLYRCNTREYVFTLFRAQELPSLQELKIISCQRVEQIVKREMEGTATENTIEFPQVNILILEKLPNFTGSCQEGFTVKWLALNTVRVVECPKIRKSMLGTVDRPLLKSVEVIRCQPWENEADPESNIFHLFKSTDPLSALENLTIEDSDQLRKYLQMEFQKSSFGELRTLEARQCNKELNKFLSILIRQAHKLEQLTVAKCELLEKVFDLRDIDVDKEENGKLRSLKTMKLFGLPKLNCIWNKDPRGIVDLGNLVKLEIIECGLPKGPLSTAVLEKLAQLEELKIDSCKKIEDVVQEDTELQTRTFSKLKNLQLVNLEKFINFNTGFCNFRFPSLLSLRIEYCPYMNAFTTGFLTNQPTNESDRMDKCPNLQTLKLVGLKTFREMWHDWLISTIGVSETKEVEVDSLSSLRYIFPLSMLPRLEKLETLVVRNCTALSYVFPLREKDPARAFQILKVVRLKSCDSLERLLLPSRCPMLREIEISDCSILRDIFIDQEKMNQKSFHGLESIVLKNLPELSSFSLETFEFPSLQKVRIVNCPAMKTFSRNVSITAADNFFVYTDCFENVKELNLINVGASQSHDALFEVLFDIKEDSSSGAGKTGSLPRLQELGLMDLPIKHLLNREPQIPVLTNLTSLKIVSCGTMDKLFSISLAQHLSALKLLKLYDCKNLVQVLQGGGGRREAAFKSLERLILKHLPNLFSFCKEDFDFDELPKLKMVKVEDIPNMNKFVMRPLKTPNLKEVYVTYITKCWLGDLNETITYMHHNQEKLRAEVWVTHQSSPGSGFRHYTDAAESSSQGMEKLIGRFKEGKTELH